MVVKRERSYRWGVAILATFGLGWVVALALATVGALSFLLTMYFLEPEPPSLEGALAWLQLGISWIMIVAFPASLVVTALAFAVTLAVHVPVSTLTQVWQRRLIYTVVYTGPVAVGALAPAFFTNLANPAVIGAGFVTTVVCTLVLAWCASTAVHVAPHELDITPPTTAVETATIAAAV